MKKLRLIFLITLLSLSNEALSQITVSGMVIEITTGEPISRATVFVNDEYNIAIYPPLRTVTDEDGLYELKLPNGKYHIGVYSYYEAEGDTFALAYEPGIFSLPDSMNHYFEDHEFEIDFGMSRIEFERQLDFKKNKPNVFDPTTATEFVRYNRVWQLIRCRTYTNLPTLFEEKPISFFEQKSW